jgi:hypothetical protein
VPQLAEEDAFDNEKDAASVAYNAAVKGAAKVRRASLWMGVIRYVWSQRAWAVPATLLACVVDSSQPSPCIKMHPQPLTSYLTSYLTVLFIPVAAQAGKLFNKLTKIAAAKIKDEGKLGLREDSNGSGASLLGRAMQCAAAAPSHIMCSCHAMTNLNIRVLTD